MRVYVRVRACVCRIRYSSFHVPRSFDPEIWSQRDRLLETINHCSLALNNTTTTCSIPENASILQVQDAAFFGPRQRLLVVSDLEFRFGAQARHVLDGSVFLAVVEEDVGQVVGQTGVQVVVVLGLGAVWSVPQGQLEIP